MSTLFYERNPFDILVRNFFQDAGTFLPLAESKVPHPVDIYTTETHLVFDIACTGIAKEDLEIQTQSNTLRVNYDKSKTDDKGVEYIHRGIAKRSFNLGWKLASRFDLGQAEAKLVNGLLEIQVPFAEAAKPKSLKIK